jgi:hypothetical protein
MSFLCEYYHDLPFLDDRWVKTRPRIALDIDEVIADFCQAYASRYGDVDSRPSTYYFDPKMSERLDELKNDKGFWLNIPILNRIDFTPHCYITARSVDVEWTEEWLEKSGFPKAKVYSVGFGQHKMQAFAVSGADVLIDDSVHHFLKFKEHGFPVMLFDACHNQDFNAGLLRINIERLNQISK